MNNCAERKKTSGLIIARKRPKIYGLLIFVFTLSVPGIVCGISANPGDTCMGLSAKSYHTCILNSEGNVYCYGYNPYGQAEDYYNGDAVGVSVGGFHTCVLKADGNVDCYGANYQGQAEDYTDGYAIGVTAGYYHTCILNSKGNVYCYGDNSYGQAEDYLNGDAVGVSAGGFQTCVLKADGNTDCYGYNYHGQAEDYTGGDAIGVSVGLYHTCILNSEGNVYCFGYNGYGQAEDYTNGDAIGVSTGGFHTCVLKADGNTDCYGYNYYGQAEDYTDGDAIGVSAGHYHACILNSEGNVYCFGNNRYGQAENYQIGNAVCKLESTNQPPVFDPIEPINVLEYDLVDFILTATDPDGDNFDYSCVGLPDGSVFDAVNGAFSWIPSYDQAGTYVITCMAIDDGTPSKTGQLDVIISVNDILPSALVYKIIDIIRSDVNLSHKVSQPYFANLKKVNEFIDEGRITPAINQLDAFTKKIKADIRKGRMTDGEGQIFIDMVGDIKNKLNAS